MIRKVKDFYHKFMALSRPRKAAFIGLIVLLFLIVVPLATYLYFAWDIANEERLMNRNNTGVVLLDRHGDEFYRAYNANVASDRDLIAFEDMPPHLVEALISAEDRNFYEHGGYSVRSIGAALYANLLNRDASRYGGSTITQQLAKNALLSHDKTYFRKYQELALAIAIERHYEKDKILEMYLNSVYFGEGAFGIENAAQTYFDKSAVELDTAESSILVAILPGPSSLSPISGDLDAAKANQEAVLSRMAEDGYITDEERDALAAQQLNLQTEQELHEDSLAIHFAETVIDELKEEYGEEEIARSGFQVTTTLDAVWQEIAEDAVAAHIAQIESLGAENASAIVIDPETGHVRVMVGSADWSNPDFGTVNMAMTPRQPGSSFKPIYYAEALEEEVITPAKIYRDEPTSFGEYEPQNFDRSFRGNVTVRRSLANSLNIPAVKVMEDLGVSRAVEGAQRLGIDTVDDPTAYGLSLALGTAETRLIDMTNAYAAFAAGGEQFEPATIESIDNKFDREIYEDRSPRGESVMSAEASFLISSIMADDAARAETFGSSLSIGRPAAVKTGTTDDNRDAWTIGYTPNLAAGVWVGNNSNEAMSAVGGSSGAAPIWRTIMINILSDMPAEDFERPGGVESALICHSNGLVADRKFSGSYTEYFIRGTLPSGRCDTPDPEREEREPEPEVAPPREEEREIEPEEPEPEPEEPDEPEPEEPDEEDEGDDTNDGPPGS